MLAHRFGLFTRGLHVGIVGSGPAGFFTADRLLKTPNVKVDIYEKFPVPYGLARFGVAPDHPEVKLCMNKFEQVAQHENCQFFGNVLVGSDIHLDELRQHYDAIVLSYGAEDDKALGIPGEQQAKGVHSARAFVGWYNGHPEHRNLELDLSVEKVVVVGQGNVALDVARILLTPLEELAKTDITQQALRQLEKSKVKEVKLVGRRGPVQAAFTIKELREMTKIPNCQVVYDNYEETLKLLEDEKPQWSKDRAKKRLMELLQQSGTPPAAIKQDTLKSSLKFLRSPVEIKCHSDSRVKSLVVAVNKLDPKTQKATPTGELEEEECGMVLRSIGYKSLPIKGVPFDDAQGLVPNVNGRVCTDNTLKTLVPGLYTSGWLKRGPTGVIVSTMIDAQDTAVAITEDIEKGTLKESPEKKGHQTVLPLLKSRGVDPVTFAEWKAIDAEETARGQSRGAPREKIVDVREMLRIAKGSDPEMKVANNTS